MTRDQAERLIERLADKTLSKGCLVYDKTDFPHEILMRNYAGNYLCECVNSVQRTLKLREIKEILGHPIMLTDVLEKLGGDMHKESEVIIKWRTCGFTKSLQDIMLDGQFDAPRGKTVPSAPHELFEYLIQLFPEI